jgi:hypothetical protein
MAIVEGWMLAVIHRKSGVQQAAAELKDPELVFVGQVTLRLALGEVRTQRRTR